VSNLGPLITLVRHGETAWSRDGRHTSRTDLDLTGRGEAQARALAGLLADCRFDAVLASPRRRAWRTAELAGLEPCEVDDDLREWDYGELEGRTSAEIARELPGWSIWDGPWIDGENATDVAERADRVIRRLLSFGPGAQVALVGHGHFSRALAARWLGAEVRDGRWLALDTATVSELGWEHSRPVVWRWNVAASR
jgi:probable phosphoglycerate mutase